MLKKIIIILILIGFTGALIWGGINRTQAKAGENEGHGAVTSANGNQNRVEEHDHEDCDEDGHQNEINADSLNQGQGNGNGARAQGRGEDGRGSGGQQGQGNGRSEPLDVTEIEALYMALDDEYHALAVYQSVMATFGEVEPFAEIAVSEQRHIDALINQFNKNDLTIPENPWIGNVPTFDSLQRACQAGVEAEIANVDLYDQLFSMTDDPSLTRVFTNLSNASLNSHLPQFEACQ